MDTFANSDGTCARTSGFRLVGMGCGGGGGGVSTWWRTGVESGSAGRQLVSSERVGRLLVPASRPSSRLKCLLNTSVLISSSTLYFAFAFVIYKVPVPVLVSIAIDTDTEYRYRADYIYRTDNPWILTLSVPD